MANSRAEARQFYMCAFGTLTRLTSTHHETPASAALECFGVVDRVTVIAAGTSRRKLRNHNFLVSLKNELARIHHAATGNLIR